LTHLANRLGAVTPYSTWQVPYHTIAPRLGIKKELADEAY
jgi:hypothetical protein